MKRLMNLMMVVILIYTVSVMPINTVVFGIDFARIFAPIEDDQVGTSAPAKYAFTPVSDVPLRINPDVYKLYLDLSKPMSKELLKEKLKIKLNLIDSLGHQVSFDQSNLLVDLSQNGARYTLSLDLSQATLNLVNDNYITSLALTLDKEEFSTNFTLFYANDALSPNGKSAAEYPVPYAPYFFSDSTGTLSLPVYTATQSGKNPYRRILATLNQVPTNPLLDKQEAFPVVSNIWYSAGLMELKLNSRVLTNYADSKRAHLVLNNLLKTAAFTTSDTIVNKVRITVDGSQSSTAFGGINLANEFAVERTPVVYTALIENNQMLWYPISVPVEDNMTTMVATLVKGLMHPSTFLEDQRTAPVMPSVISVKQATLIDGILRVTFSEGLRSAFGERDLLIRTALEGMSLSFSSIPGVKSIELYIGEERLTHIGPVEFGGQLKRPDYFNCFDLIPLQL